MQRTPILFLFFFFHESVTDQINERDKSVHAGHAANKSCVPDSQTACTGHAGTLYFQACLYFLISRVLLNQIQHSSLSNVIISLFGKNTLIQLLLASN